MRFLLYGYAMVLGCCTIVGATYYAVTSVRDYLRDRKRPHRARGRLMRSRAAGYARDGGLLL